jgi:hypothetical protein
MPPVSRHSHFHDVLDALGRPGCALCSLAARTRWRRLDALAYESVNDIALRAKLRAALGFCNRHAWYFVETVRAVLGTAIIYRDVLHAVQRRAADAASPDPFAPAGPCLGCVAERDAVDDAIQTIAEAVDAADLRAAFRASEGLCAPHLLRALARAGGDARPKLLRLAAEAGTPAAPDSRRLRWQAAGAAHTFGTDDLALADDAASEASADLPPAESFACTVCAGVRADLAGLASWRQLDDGAGGVCNVHAWQPAGRDAAELYRRQAAAARDQAAALAAATESLVAQAMRGLRLARPAADPPLFPLRCVVCRHQAAVEARLCHQHAPGPLCLPHLRRALTLRGPDVLAQARPTWRQLDQHLGEYLRKEDYRFRSEPRGDEQKSPRWAVALIAGAAGIR